MTFIQFDILNTEKILSHAGMPRPQAEAITRLNRDIVRQISRMLVSKTDLRLALAESRHDMLRWIMGLLLAQTALLATIILSLGTSC